MRSMCTKKVVLSHEKHNPILWKHFNKKIQDKQSKRKRHFRESHYIWETKTTHIDQESPRNVSVSQTSYSTIIQINIYKSLRIYLFLITFTSHPDITYQPPPIMPRWHFPSTLPQLLEELKLLSPIGGPGFTQPDTRTAPPATMQGSRPGRSTESDHHLKEPSFSISKKGNTN